jgi:serine/threonine protein kinase
MSETPILANYTFSRQIGTGSFATVWFAEHSLSHLPVAIKIVDRSALNKEDAEVRLVREIQIIKQTDHPFIAKLFEIITTTRYTYLVMEYADQGSILDFVNRMGRLSEVQARRYFSQLISAIEYLHEVHKIAHRDLKAENVLLDRHLNLRLIDFGLSNTFEDAGKLKSACGSPGYAAPEMIRGERYTKSVDIWSSGILLYAMVCGELPFDDETPVKVLQKIAYLEPTYPSYLSVQCIDLLRKILTKDPAARISIARIHEHPWFSESEYRQFLQFDFSQGDEWRVHGVDREIVDAIGAMGLDTKQLIQSLLLGEYTQLTAVYSIMRRNSLTDKIRDFMSELIDKPRADTGAAVPRQFSQTAKSVPQFAPGVAGARAPIRMGMKPGKMAQSDAAKEGREVPAQGTPRRVLPRPRPVAGDKR